MTRSMEQWQEKYIENTRRIVELSDLCTSVRESHDVWLQSRMKAKAECASLREENVSLLGRFLFPALDGLHSASEEDVASLEEFADVLMDWSRNLDCGVYCAIHGALLSVYRVRKDRNKVIKELYKLVPDHNAGDNIRVPDKIGNKGVFRLVVNVSRGSYLLDIALVHNHYGIGHGKGFFLVVGHI